MNSLLQDKVPFFVTLFIGALGWAVANFVDRVVLSPIIEYEIKIHADSAQSGQSEVRVLLRNLSRTVAHKDVLIRLRKAKEEAAIRFVRSGCDIIPIAPTSLGQTDGTAVCDDDVAEFRAGTLPPQGAAILVARYHGAGEITIQGGPAGSGGDAYYLAPASFQTCLARNEFSILFSGLAVWLVLMLIWFYCESRRRKITANADVKTNV